MTVVASLALTGFAAMVSAMALAVAAEQPDARAEGRAAMVQAQFQLAHDLKR